MSSQARHAVVTALVDLAGEPDYRNRADAGRALASFAELPSARQVLLTLMLDDRDTFVTHATAEALLRRQDAIGFGLVASALDAAEPGHVDWIGDALVDVFGVFARDRDAALRECQGFAEHPDERVRRGADDLCEMLAGIEPVLHPEDD